MTASNQETMTVSVIIPTYNRAGLVRAAIESALEQTRVPDEILVIDDGSTDDTPEVLGQFDAPVKVIRQPNRGRSAARNAGLASANGDAVIFLDSDDLLMPECIERFVEVLEANPEVGVAYADAFLCDEDAVPLARYGEAMPGARPSGMVLGELARRNFLTVTSMVRRSELDGIEFELGMEHAEDYDFWRRLAARCRFRYLDQPLMRYRFHEGMTVSSGLGATLKGEIEVQRRFFAMPEFAQADRGAQARAYCAHGIKNAMAGNTDIAKTCFHTAIRTDPKYPGGYALAFFSLFGPRVLRYAILKRRQLAGNQLGTTGGPMALTKQRKNTQRTAEASKSPTHREVVAVHGGADG
jgi:glycosyltransferase involved in cell wall biosynthesis